MTLKNATTESTNGCHSTAGEHALAARRLWCDVVLLALTEATTPSDRLNRTQSHHGVRPSDKRQAIAWVKTRDFRTVCELAGVDASAVRKVIEKGESK